MFERQEHRDHDGLGRHRREEHRAAAHPPEEERHQEDPEHDAVEDRAEDIDRLDEVLGEAGEEREGDGDDSPRAR